MESDENNQSVNDFVYDTSKLLKLLQSISLVTESTTLQSIINIYLKELLDAPYVLMVPLLPSSEEGLIQVVNDEIIEKEIRFSVSYDDESLPLSVEKFSIQKSPINCANMKNKIRAIMKNIQNTSPIKINLG